MRVREERQHLVKIALTFSWMDSSMDVNYYKKKDLCSFVWMSQAHVMNI